MTRETKKTKKLALKHYLLTVTGGDVDDVTRALHAYLMTDDDPEIFERVLNTMISAMENDLGIIPFPIAMVTGPLSPDAIKVIRGMIEDNPKEKELLATVTNFHLAMFQPYSQDDHKHLMEIH